MDRRTATNVADTASSSHATSSVSQSPASTAATPAPTALRRGVDVSFLPAVEDGVGFEFQPLSGFEVDDRDVLVGGRDHVVTGLDVPRVGGDGLAVLLGALDVERERHRVALLELVDGRRERDEPQPEADDLVEHDARVLDDPDRVDGHGRDVGHHRPADAVGERRRHAAHEEARLALAAVVIYRHAANIARLRGGTEPRIGAK